MSSASTTTSDQQPATANIPFSKTPLGQFFIDVGAVITSKWTLLVFTILCICHMAIFAQNFNEFQNQNTSGTAVLFTCAVCFILVHLCLVGLSDVCMSLKLKLLKNIQGTSNPFDFLCKLNWIQMAFICIMTVAPGIYLAGTFTAEPENLYAKIINGRPLENGASIWVFPSGFFTEARAIEKKQTFWLSGVRSETADSAQIIGSLSFDGQLTQETRYWVSFDKKKKEFTEKLKTAYIRAISKINSADLEKHLMISFKAGKESDDAFADSVILPSESGTIEAYGFKILAKQKR
jgi:hypothetical protein